MLAPASSQYIEEERRNFSLYTIQSRAIPHLADGLKVVHRRVLWMARNGHHYKTATLAGVTMSIHPHSGPEDTINTLTAPYGNNIPLFDEDGAFGTYLIPDSFGAPRYTSVSVSSFTKDVIFADLDIIPLIDNYDETQLEPLHFLPLVPVVMVNSISGIAVGFACNILPRNLKDIIKAQINYLKGKVINDCIPDIIPYTQQATNQSIDIKSGNTKWSFTGAFNRVQDNKVRVTLLPYGLKYTKFLEILEQLKEKDKIISFVDSSKVSVDILVKFPPTVLTNSSDAAIINTLKLINNETENFNVIDFDGRRVITTNFVDCISRFTNWRVQWYINRYEHLLQLLQVDIQKYKDILLAIKSNVGSMARKIESRAELTEYLSIIKIVHIDYIASLPVYRFTIEEKAKIEVKLADALILENKYNGLLNNEDARIQIYIDELTQIQNKHCKK